MKTKERELLRRISSHSESRIPAHFIKEIQELLAQPEQEQEPVGVVRIIGGYPDNSERVVEWVRPYKYLKDGDKLYLAPQTREPLSDKEITKNTPKLIHIGERLAFRAGVRFAEKHHGIGVDDDN